MPIKSSILVLAFIAGAAMPASAAGVRAGGQPIMPHAVPLETPDAALDAGEDGVVYLAFTIEADGTTSGVTVASSSGYQDLDDAAVKFARHWTFTPPTLDGTPTRLPTHAEVKLVTHPQDWASVKDDGTLGCRDQANTPEQRLRACTHILQSRDSSDDERAVALHASASLKAAAGDYDAALADIDAMLAKTPNYGEGWFLRGDVEYLQHRYDKAAADFDRAAAFGPARSVVWLKVGLTQLALQHYEPALQAIDRAVASARDGDAAPLFIRIRLDAAMGDKAAALADAEKIVAMKPGAPDSYLARGAAHQALAQTAAAMADYDKAIAEYDAMLATGPKRAVALYGRGIAHLRHGDKAQGEADVAAATAIDPSVADTLKDYGLAP